MEEYRLNSKKPYKKPEITVEDGGTEGESHHQGSANTRLPFGLCKRYGIAIGDDWTPRDAWNALKGIGISPEEEYEKLKQKEKKPKPKKETETENQPQEQKPKNEITKEDMELIQSKMRFGRKRFSKNLFNDAWAVGTDEAKQIVVNVAKNGRISWAFGEKNGCYVSVGDIELTGVKEGDGTVYATGEVFWHETFHAIDGNYIDLQNAYKEQHGWLWFSDNSERGATSTVILANGKTLHDIVNEEVGAFDAIKDATAEHELRRRKLIEEKNPDYDTLKAESDKAKEERDVAMKRQMDLSDKIDQVAPYGWRWDASRIPQEIADGEDYKAYKVARADYQAKNDDYYANLNKYLDADRWTEEMAKQTMSTVSDMMTSRYGQTGVFSLGHESSYWAKNRYHRVEEFWAGFGSSKQSNKQDYETLKRFFPKSVEAAEELLAMISSGKLKTRMQQKRGV